MVVWNGKKVSELYSLASENGVLRTSKYLRRIDAEKEYDRATREGAKVRMVSLQHDGRWL